MDVGQNILHISYISHKRLKIHTRSNIANALLIAARWAFKLKTALVLCSSSLLRLHAQHLRAVVRLGLARGGTAQQRVVELGVLQLRHVGLGSHADHSRLAREGAHRLTLKHVDLAVGVNAEVKDGKVAAAQRLVRALGRVGQLSSKLVVERRWTDRAAVVRRLVAVGREELVLIRQALVGDGDLVRRHPHWVLGREQVLGGGEHRHRLTGFVLDDGEADLPPERDEALAHDDRVELERLSERGGQLGGVLDLRVGLVVVVVVVGYNALLLPLLLQLLHTAAATYCSCYILQLLNTTYCYYYDYYYYGYYTLEMPIELSSQHGLSTKGYGTVGTCICGARARACA